MPDESKSNLTSQVVAWAAGQPFNNVLLLAILGAIMWGGWFAMTTAIPSHLKQIQQGYESLTEAHREERKELRETYGQWMQKQTTAAHSATSTASVE